MTGLGVRSQRVLTVALNPAVDIAYSFDGFQVGAIHAVKRVDRVAGGKGNNVARVLRILGVPVTATGFAGGHAGAFLQEELRRLGIAAEFQPIAGESRTCLALVDTESNRVTEVREPGPAVSAEEASLFLERYTRLVAGAGAVVLAGSQPPGLPANFYGQLVALARQAGAFVVLDTSGDPLREALAAGPDLVKPNRDELAAWAGRELREVAGLAAWSGRELREVAGLAAAAGQMRAAGARAVALSLGAEGLLYIGDEGSWLLQPPPVTALNPVGSGDSLVAGIVAGRLAGLAMVEALRLGVACGTANAMTAAVASLDRGEVLRLEPQVRILPLG
jgi:tagatose 6-phosphate kinase